MSISADEVKAIARLARLSIDPSDIPEYAAHLSRILTFVEQMNAADTNGVEPMAHPLDLAARLRPRHHNRRQRPRNVSGPRAAG